MLNEKYTLFTRIPIVKNDNGEIFCHDLWAKDLKLHLDYIKEFGICCPVETSNDTEGLTNISSYGIQSVFALKRDYGIKSVLRNLFSNFFVVVRACKNSTVVHSGGAGWAFPLSFYILFLKPFMSFKWVMIIESSFWMLEEHEKKTLRKIIEHHFNTILLKRCLKLATARIFTQSFYRKYFLGDEKDNRTMINSATWINQENILSSEAVSTRNLEKAKANKTTSIIYPSRLIVDKGVRVVLDAIKILQSMDVDLCITIMGSGELENNCKHTAENNYGRLKVEYLNPVKYGDDFFKMLSQYDFVLVPTIKQEQPRIIFDAFSQGVPVIGSDTFGILDIINKDNSLTFKQGDSHSLAEVIKSVIGKPEIAHQMGLSGLSYVSGKTHLKMHHDRHIFLEEVLSTGVAIHNH